MPRIEEEGKKGSERKREARDTTGKKRKSFPSHLKRMGA